MGDIKVMNDLLTVGADVSRKYEGDMTILHLFTPLYLLVTLIE